jgi:hypothetical protein
VGGPRPADRPGKMCGVNPAASGSSGVA